jgi:hypothetical protein
MTDVKPDFNWMSSLHLQIKQNPVNFNIQCAGVAPLPIWPKWRYLILKYNNKKGTLFN